MDITELERQIKAYEDSKRILLYADEETAKRTGMKVGDSYTRLPTPKNKEEAFENLEKFSGLNCLVSLIKAFNKKFPRNLRALSDELKSLNDFIDDAEKISLIDAFDPVKINSNNALKFEYLKWKYDYYKNENLEFYSYPSFISANLTTSYAKYFLYKKWLEEQITLFTPKENEETVNMKDELEIQIIHRSENPEIFINNKEATKSVFNDLIIDHLDENYFVNDGSYQNLVSALEMYFDFSTFPLVSKQINFRRVNKIKIGWALSNIYREIKPTEALSFEYLKYAKENLSLFKQYPLEENNFRKSNLYKMFTQKP